MADATRRLRIAIIAPVNTSQFNDLLLKAVAPVLPPDVDVSVHNIDQGHDCIQNRTDWLENGFPVVKLAKSLQDQGFDGIWLSDFDMCGVEAAREVIDIPIIGGFPTSAFTALGLSQRFGILTILPSTLAMQQGHVLTYGQSENFAGIAPIDCPVDQLSNVDVVVAKSFPVALKLINERGAQSLLLGCTGFVGVAEKLSVLLSEALQAYVPVIDPNQAGIGYLISLVRMGIRPSRLCYSPATING
ncbi:aspartate/glutamate racemase family protein [Aquabacterium parvum]|jgi:Asp/Glu/hydantoin racemase|uniref:aspartate/glutamate racemase family protein n=1 Tax=Aquabacterium parvum TaxID=70584 RepID=UPI000718BE3E|nr:aspartate/glutamate racemase family protein [Aquabacterium parvum]MBU0916182.1 racemase [Gammaproteobacteria bacterium]